jgi:carboxylate-amine ligase
VYLVHSYNRFEACRFGYRGEMVEPYESRKKRIGEDILDTVAAAMPHAERLGGGAALAELAGDVRREYSDAGWLRARHKAGGSLADVVRESSARWSGATSATR